MEKKDNKIMSKISDFIAKNSGETTKSYVFFTILAGILTLVPVSSLILGIIDQNGYINDNIYVISFYIIKIIGFLIWFCVLKEITKPKKIIAIIAIIFLILSFISFNGMSNIESGIDYIGQALAIAMIFNLCMYIYYIFAFILFMAYAKKFIFKKKAIITIIIAIVLIVFLAFLVKYTSIEKVGDSIPSVSDLENELVERNLYTDEYLLFGVDNIGNNIHKIDFDSNSEETYPSYIYYGYKTNNLDEDARYSDWIIYYTNGKLYAVLGNYSDINYSKKNYKIEIAIYYFYANILSEDDEIYTYNWEENYYEKIDIEDIDISTEKLRYYYEDGTYIDVEVLQKNLGSFYDYEIIDKIDSITLDNYANNL